jgi:hypothetical protein
MIFRKEPFFYGHDNYDQLVKIAKVRRPCPHPLPWSYAPPHCISAICIEAEALRGGRH